MRPWLSGGSMTKQQKMKKDSGEYDRLDEKIRLSAAFIVKNEKQSEKVLR